MWVFVSGLCLGWLVGLSLSQVLHLVVGSIVGIAAAVISALSGVTTSGSNTEEPKPTILFGSHLITVSALPIALFLLGIAIAAPIGVVTRTHEWLAVRPNTLGERWVSLGLLKRQVAQRLFEHTYPIYAAGSSDDKSRTIEPLVPQHRVTVVGHSNGVAILYRRHNHLIGDPPIVALREVAGGYSMP